MRRNMKEGELDWLDEAAAWAALDNNLSGFVSLREFDERSFDLIAALRRWGGKHFAEKGSHGHHKASGTCVPFVKRMFRFMDRSNSEKVSDLEFYYALRLPDGTREEQTVGTLGVVTDSKSWEGMLAADIELSADEQERQDQLESLFEGLDIRQTKRLEISDLRFLDKWDIDADIAEEEAWRRVVLIQEESDSFGHLSSSVPVGGRSLPPPTLLRPLGAARTLQSPPKRMSRIS